MLGFAELVKPESFSLLTMLTLYPGISFKKTHLSLSTIRMYSAQCTLYSAHGRWFQWNSQLPVYLRGGLGAAFDKLLWHTAGDLLPLRQQWLQSVVFTVAHFTRLLILCFAVPVAYNSFSALRKCLSTMQRGERRHCNFEHI